MSGDGCLLGMIGTVCNVLWQRRFLLAESRDVPMFGEVHVNMSGEVHVNMSGEVHVNMSGEVKPTI